MNSAFSPDHLASRFSTQSHKALRAGGIPIFLRLLLVYKILSAIAKDGYYEYKNE